MNDNNVFESYKRSSHHYILKPLPSTTNSPIANYYSELRWGDGFEYWNLVRFSTPMDGNCLFHAICNSFWEPYHSQMLNGKAIGRDEIISRFRKGLSKKLASKVSDSSDTSTYYNVLNGGNTSNFAKSIPEFELNYMQSQLNSNLAIGYGYIEFIGNVLKKDIYILDAIRHDIYISDELAYSIKGNRDSIILYYRNGHYELIGIQINEDKFHTHFDYTHSFIKFLYARVNNLISLYNPDDLETTQ